MTVLKPTLEHRLLAAGGRPTGFDYLRIILAILVVLSHTINVSYGPDFTRAVWSGPFRPFIAFILPMFFALSGFLVAGSLERCDSLISFIGLRVMRIVPALFVEVVLSAFLLGPLFTTATIAEYFSSPLFHAYFLNILGFVHMELPGVFATNPWPTNVNQQLWTLPWELKCYALLAATWVIGFVRPKSILLWFIFIMHALLLAVFIWTGLIHKSTSAVSGWLLVLSFLVGVALYIFRKTVPFNRIFFVASLVAMVVCLSIPYGDFLTALPASYATVYLGLQNPKRIGLVSNGDYSYGVFLYGFPIQQAIAAFGPPTWHWYVSIFLALPLTAILAYFSWWQVEKPVLKLRPQLIKLEAWILTALKFRGRPA